MVQIIWICRPFWKAKFYFFFNWNFFLLFVIKNRSYSGFTKKSGSGYGFNEYGSETQFCIAGHWHWGWCCRHPHRGICGSLEKAFSETLWLCIYVLMYLHLGTWYDKSNDKTRATHTLLHIHPLSHAPEHSGTALSLLIQVPDFFSLWFRTDPYLILKNCMQGSSLKGAA